MKRFFALILAVMLVLFLAGCLRLEQKATPQQPAEQEQGAEPAPSPEATAPAQPTLVAPVPAPVLVEQPLQPVRTEDIATPLDLPGEEQPDKGILVIDPLEPREYFDIQNMKLRRISRDRGELKEITLVLRNIENVPLTPIVRLLFDKADVKGRVGMVEQDFPLPRLEPGMKLVRTFPVSILFSSIEEDKTITLKFYKKFESPRGYYGTYKKTFRPINEFESLEIKWV